MTDRLAQMEAAATSAHHPWWDRAEAPTDLGRAVAAVRTLADAEDDLSRLPDYPHQPDCGALDAACATCYGLMIRDDIRAALANLEGGA